MTLHDVGGGGLKRLRIAMAADDIASESLNLFLRSGHGKANLLLGPRDVPV